MMWNINGNQGITCLYRKFPMSFGVWKSSGLSPRWQAMEREVSKIELILAVEVYPELWDISHPR